MSNNTLHSTLNNLQDRIAEFRDGDRQVSPEDWRKLRTEVDALCNAINRTDSSTAHDLLPTLGDMITALDQVIEMMQVTE